MNCIQTIHLKPYLVQIDAFALSFCTKFNKNRRVSAMLLLRLSRKTIRSQTKRFEISRVSMEGTSDRAATNKTVL
jgi:hypothetical protein